MEGCEDCSEVPANLPESRGRVGVEGSAGKRSNRFTCAGELAQSAYACTHKCVHMFACTHGAYVCLHTH